MDEINKMPPFSQDAEQSVLGAILIDNNALITATEKITGDDFYQNAHKYIYDAMVELNKEGFPIDATTLKDKLENRDLLQNIGGIGYLAALTSIAPSVENIGAYADIVKKYSMQRRFISTANAIASKAYNAEESLDDIVEFAEKNIFDLSNKNTHRDLTPISSLTQSVYANLEHLFSKNEDFSGLTTGYRDLDKKINGLSKTDLILLAARPAMGKTALALNMVENVAVKENAVVAMFSLEMSKEQLVQRILSSFANIEINKLKNGSLNTDDWTKIVRAVNSLNKLKIFIDDTPGIKISELRSKARKLKLEHGLDAIFIDYLQLMEGDGRNENRQQEISTISRSLKKIAKDLECPIIALSQLSRRTEMGADHRPKLSDLRESGAIEQDADIVMFLYRDEYYNPDSEKKGIGEVIVSKNRHGETGTIELIWAGNVQKFLPKNRDLS